jgi:Calcineurin-like phosphoesterase
LIYQGKRIVAALIPWLVAAILSAAFLPASGYCEHLRFVFLADSRSDTRPSDPANLDQAINTPVLNAIIAQIQNLSPPPAFVVYAGDQGYRGGFTFSGNDYYVFQTFKDLFAPLTSAGIPLYTAIGNHELYSEHSALGFFLANQQQYQQTFSENPANGPPGHDPTYDHLVYSFSSPGGDAFFAVLDPYHLTGDVKNINLSGTIDPTQLTWLQSQLAQTKATHKFLFIHVPYYYVNRDPDEDTPPHDATWTQLWSLLDNNNFDLFCCGHSHLYSRKTIDSSIAPDPQPTPPIQWHNNVVQLLCGTCGAPVSTGSPKVNRAEWHVYNAADTYYFSVVDISGPQVTVTSYQGNTGAYTVFDSFTLHSANAAVNFLLLD